MYKVTRCIERMENILKNNKKMTDCLVMVLFATSLTVMCNAIDLKAESIIDVATIEVQEDYSDDEKYELTIQPNDIQFVGASYFDDTKNSEVVEEESDLPVLNLEIEEASGSLYASDSIKVRCMPTKDEESLGTLNKADEVTITGKCGDWTRIAYNGTDGFVLSKYLSDTKPKVGIDYEYDGSKLTKSKGVNYGPSGKETYYNLPMDGVVRIMRNQGYSESEYPYWVREDGVKMLGDYVMIAANLDERPRGSLVPTSLGMGIVCDTGGFASSSRTWIDIATNW